MADPATAPKRLSLPGWLTARTTPDRLRLAAMATVLVIAAVGTASWLLTERLVSETAEVATSTGEVLIATQQVNASFAEADTAAVSVHLAGADGNREQRRLYELAVDRATSSLEQVARLVGDDERSHEALGDIASLATQYTGRIEAARLASIEELADADSLLSSASDLNRFGISPDVQLIADRARARFDSQTASSWYSVAIILLVIGLLALAGAQYLLHRRFRRLMNVPLALASVAFLLLIVMTANAFSSQQRAFNAAEDEAFDAILVSEQIQQTAYRHRALGTSSVLAGTPATAELQELASGLVNPQGLLDQARTQAGSDRELAGADEVIARWERYVNESDQVQAALQSNDIDRAEELAQGPANAAFNGFNTSVEAALLDNREQFLGQLDDASSSLRWLRGAIVFGSLLAALLAWWGFGQRIGEYR